MYGSNCCARNRICLDYSIIDSKNSGLHKGVRSVAAANYVKLLSSLAHTIDGQSPKPLIANGLTPVAEDRRKVTLVTLVTKVIASVARQSM